jgi:hypothetical protein
LSLEKLINIQNYETMIKKKKPWLTCND